MLRVMVLLAAGAAFGAAISLWSLYPSPACRNVPVHDIFADQR